MSALCKRLHPRLVRVAEGDASPEDALAAARHLTDCTACRIVLARERRLAEMIEEGLPDALPIGEDFVRTVMARLPETSLRRRRTGRRALKLAGLAGLLLAASLAASHIGLTPEPSGAWPGPPRWPAAPQDTGVPGAAGSLGAAAGIAIEILTSAAPISGPALYVSMAGIVLLLLVCLALPIAAATALGLASLVATSGAGGPSLTAKACASAPDPRR